MHSVRAATQFCWYSAALPFCYIPLCGEDRLERTMRFLIALAAVATLGLGACTPADQNAAEQDVNQAADETGQALENAGQEVGAAADATGEAIEGATNDAANSVAAATDDNEATHP